MKRVLFNLALLGLVTSTCSVSAYPERTHQRITKLALSGCSNEGIAQDVQDAYLPMPSLSQDDIALIREVGISATELNFSAPKISEENLLRIGVILEDAFPRSLHHFYDPVRNRALSPLGFPIGYKSYDWALEIEADALGQNFSFDDLKRTFVTERRNAESEEEADTLLAKALLTNGYVAHHVQDMAQPQHTRNDSHLVIEALDRTPLKFINYRRSMYEKFMNVITDKFPNLEMFAPCSYPEVTRDALIGGDASKKGVSPKRLWTGDGKGLADYANRGFVTENTNFNRFFGTGYPAPVLSTDPATMTRVRIEDLCNEAEAYLKCNNSNLSGWVTFFGNMVEDRLFPEMSAYNPRMTSLSIFNDNEDIVSERLTGRQHFALNRWTHFEAAKLLIPRAVAYSRAIMLPASDAFLRRNIPFKLGVKRLTNEVRFTNDTLDELDGQFVVSTVASNGTGGYQTSEPIPLKLAPGQQSAWLPVGFTLQDSVDADFQGNWGEARGRPASEGHEATVGVISTPVSTATRTYGFFRGVSDDSIPPDSSLYVLGHNCIRRVTPFWGAYLVPGGACDRGEIGGELPLEYDAQHVVDLESVSNSPGFKAGLIRAYANGQIDGQVVDSLELPDYDTIEEVPNVGDRFRTDHVHGKLFQIAPGVLAVGREIINNIGNKIIYLSLVFQDPARRMLWTGETYPDVGIGYFPYDQ